MTRSRKLMPSHPGKLLLEEMLEPLGISQYRLAKAINVSPRRINEIVHGKRAITADTSIRLAQYFGQSPNFWLNLQSKYDIAVARAKMNLNEITPFKESPNAAVN